MGMVKGFRPNGDMGYVHCALTPPLRIQDPFPNIFKTSERTSLELYTTVAYTVCKHDGPYYSVQVQTEDVLNELPCRWFVMSHIVLGFDQRLRLAA